MALRPFAQYLTYGASTMGAPGLWIPEKNVFQRRLHKTVLIGVFYLTLTIGLSVFFPWDIFARLLYSSVQGESASVNPELYSQYRGMLWDEPQAWVRDTLNLLYAGQFSWIWAFIFALANAVVLPITVLVSAYRQPIAAAEQLRRRVSDPPAEGSNGKLAPLDFDDRSEWQWYVDRLRDSKHTAIDPFGGEVREADHLFVGVEPNAQFPMLIHRNIFSEHAYIVGQTGSGKTSLGIMPLLIQLLRGPGTASGIQYDPPPMVVVDLKGDPALFFSLKAEAEARRKLLGIDDSTEEGRKDPRCAFRFFTPEKDKASHYFNPFNSLGAANRTLMQTCQLVLESLGLNHGEGYGRSYYSRRSRQLLFKALRDPSAPKSFKELYDVLVRMGEADRDNESLELAATIEALTQYEMLAVTKNLRHPEQAIHMPSVLEHRQVVYFWLPAAIESVSVREIGKLALYTLLSAAIGRQQERQPHRQAYLVIDEFQRIAGENFKIILEQARSFGIGAILANQTQSDLRTTDMDLRPTINTNCRFRQYFSVSDPNEVNELSIMSGEELSTPKGWSQSVTSGSGGSSSSNGASQNESIKHRLTSNDIIRISDHPLDSIVLVSRGEGYTQYSGFPVPVRTTWPISLAVYKERQKMQWPTRDEYDEDATVISGKNPSDIENSREAAIAQLMTDQLALAFEKKVNTGA